MITVIAAHPNWAVLHSGLYIGNEDEFDPQDLEPVIAWRIETEQVGRHDRHSETVTPITAMGDASDSCWIVSPTGTVTDGHSYIFNTITQAIAHIRAPTPKQAMGRDDG